MPENKIRRSRKKPTPIKQDLVSSSPDFHQYKQGATMESAWLLEKKRFTRFVKLHPLILDEPSTVRVITPPDEVRCTKICQPCKLKSTCSRFTDLGIR